MSIIHMLAGILFFPFGPKTDRFQNETISRVRPFAASWPDLF
jgi:hypothetical protein